MSLRGGRASIVGLIAGVLLFAAPAAPRTEALSGPVPRTADGTPGTVVSSGGFDGLRDSDNCGAPHCLQPPDPTVAVNESWIVQAVNEQLRFTSRTGTAVATTVSLPAFFGISGQAGESDPRVAWDALHERWILSYMSWDCATGDLRLAVSDGTDPTAGWQRFDFQSPGLVPDFPAIGTSADKIVLAANYWAIDTAKTECFGNSYRGTRMVAWDWAAITGGNGAATAAATPLDSGHLNFRPALGLGLAPTDTTVHAFVQTQSGKIEYAALTGSAAAGTLALSGPADTAFPPLMQAARVVRPGQGLGIGPLDEHVSDALWRAGRLWFVSTSSCAPNQPSTCVRVGTLSTVDGSVVQDVYLGNDGMDTYVGGLGIALDGTAYVVVSRSTQSSPISTYVTYQGPSDAPGAFHPFSLVRGGGGPYEGSRWGDFVMVPYDPLDPHSVWQADEVPDATGDWTTWVSKLSSVAGPPLAGPPSAGILVPSTLGAAVSVRLDWPRPFDPGAVASWQLQERRSGGDWGTVADATTTPSLTRGLAPGTTYEYQVAATGPGGTTGSFSTSTLVAPALFQEASSQATYSGSWFTSRSAPASGGRTRYATRSGAKMTFWFAGRGIAWVAPKGPVRGSARVYVDGVYAGTVSLYSRTGFSRQLVFGRAWSVSGPHTLSIVVAGTAGHPRVDVDAFVVLR